MMLYRYKEVHIMCENYIFKLDKRYTPFLFKAIEAAKNSEFVSKCKYNINNFINKKFVFFFLSVSKSL